MLKREQRRDISGGHRTDTYHDPVVVEDISNGGVLKYSGDKHEGIGSKVDAKTITTLGVNGTEIKAAKRYHSYYQRQVFESGRWFWKSTEERVEQGSSETAVQAILKSIDWTVVESEKGNALFEGVHFDSPLTSVKAKNGKVIFNQAKNHSIREIFQRYSNFVWQGMEKDTSESTTCTGNTTTGKVEASAQEIDLTLVRGKAQEFLNQMIIKEGKLNQEFVDEIFKHENISKSGPSVFLSAIVAIAITYFTMGSGLGFSAAEVCGQAAMVSTTTAAGVTTSVAAYTTAGYVISGMTLGALTAFSVTSALAVLNCNGNLGDALKTICSSGSLKNIALATLTGGIGGYINSVLPALSISSTPLLQSLGEIGIKMAGNLLPRAIIMGDNPIKAIPGCLIDQHLTLGQQALQSVLEISADHLIM